ncbi:MAG TPA: alcohol dehydrogenase catalytic domain-containing protein [Planctomycetota bacterium]|nr:alcohol dehydrogenase catalytic domain-containing protein [Planctomycetota bacterium]
MSMPGLQRVVYLLGPERVELRRETVPEPGEGELLVRVAAATTCGTDVKVFLRGGHPRMLRVPTPFGHEIAGTVAALGKGAEALNAAWRQGDRVVVSNSAPCGRCAYCARGRENLCSGLEYLNGAFADFIIVPRRFAERSTYRIPADLPFEVAALTEPLACVLHGIDACGLEGPADVVVFGAGPIGLLFAAALAAERHRVTLADPNETRLAAGRVLGAERVLRVARGGGQAAAAREAAADADGFDVAVDATGVPEVWQDAMDSVRPGGLVNLFGGCAPGTSVPLDTHRVHYSEITIKGVYHHRPATVARAIGLLARRAFDARVLLSAERPLEELEDALRSMMRKEALKVVMRP